MCVWTLCVACLLMVYPCVGVLCVCVCVCVCVRNLYSVLVEKYHWPREEAEGLASFLTPMLAYSPQIRATAEQCLGHPWLKL
jgi:hypothetical protein